jgi:hypothetical protein
LLVAWRKARQIRTLASWWLLLLGKPGTRLGGKKGEPELLGEWDRPMGAQRQPHGESWVSTNSLGRAGLDPDRAGIHPRTKAIVPKAWPCLAAR